MRQRYRLRPLQVRVAGNERVDVFFRLAEYGFSQLVQALLDAPMFEVRWRWNSSRALAVQRNRNGKRVPPQFQRMAAEDFVAQVFPDQLACLDREIAARMLDRTLLIRPACLAPLPLAGVPGWWATDQQNDQFYQDSSVFRPPPANFQAAPVHQL